MNIKKLWNNLKSTEGLTEEEVKAAKDMFYMVLGTTIVTILFTPIALLFDNYEAFNR